MYGIEKRPFHTRNKERKPSGYFLRGIGVTWKSGTILLFTTQNQIVHLQFILIIFLVKFPKNSFSIFAFQELVSIIS